jgi:hypothetical protein
MPSVLKPTTLFAHSGFFFFNLQIRRAESLVREKNMAILSVCHSTTSSLSLSVFQPRRDEGFDWRFFARHSCSCCCRFLFPLSPRSFSILLLLLLLLFFPLVCREEEEGRIGIETQGGRQTKQREAERVSVSLFFFTT